MAQVYQNLSSRGAIRPNRIHGGHASYISQGLVTLFNRVSDWADRRRSRSHLYQMPDYILSDIGVSRAEVETEYQKPFWRA
jgi:uncharacterized protein YjiS (DUF1127 family)